MLKAYHDYFMKTLANFTSHLMVPKNFSKELKDFLPQLFATLRRGLTTKSDEFFKDVRVQIVTFFKLEVVYT